MEEKKQKKGNTAAIIICFILVMALLAMCTGGGGSGGSSGSRTCKSCHRTFTDSTNTRSIAKTGMCSNCYNNFKWASGLQAVDGNVEVYALIGKNKDITEV